MTQQQQQQQQQECMNRWQPLPDLLLLVVVIQPSPVTPATAAALPQHPQRHLQRPPPAGTQK
jgi:hypothetical protein